MALTLAAVGAIVMALLEATIVPFLAFGGAKPDLLLVYVVVLAIVAGIDHGVAAAFVGGLTIDAIATRPFGSTAFILIVAAGLAALVGRALARGRTGAVLVSIIPLSLVAPAAYLVVYSALRAPIPSTQPFANVLPDTAYSCALALLAGAFGTRLHRRYFERERIDW